MIRYADILRGCALLLLPPMAQNVLRGAIEQILFTQVDTLRGQVGHLPQAHFAGPQYLVRVHGLTPENHSRHPQTHAPPWGPERQHGIPPLPHPASHPVLAGIPAYTSIP